MVSGESKHAFRTHVAHQDVLTTGGESPHLICTFVKFMLLMHPSFLKFPL